MVAASMLSAKAMDEKAMRYDSLILSALYRENASPRTMNVLRPSEDGKKTREAVRCDFRKASTLEDIDNHVMLAIKDLVAVAKQRKMTGIIGRFRPQVLYAIEQIGSVSRMTFNQISQELYPELKPKAQAPGQVFTFPARIAPPSGAR